MPDPLRLVQPGERAAAGPARPPGLDPDTPVADLTAGQLLTLVRFAWADAGPARAPSPYDRLTPDEVRDELRVSKTSYHKLIQANVLRQLRDETAGVVFVTRAEVDRYKRETGSRPGPIANPARARPGRAA